MAFRILSLDGGGVRGAFIAGCLAEWEQQLGSPVVSYFDLVVGTSTGGCIAVMMACGIPLATIETLYSTQLAQVFKPMTPYFSGIYRPIQWTTSPFLELFTGVSTDELIQPKYDAAGLRAVADTWLGNRTLGDIQRCRLNIPAVDLQKGKPVVFKTPHLPRLYRDQHYLATEVVLATTAAPTYFHPVTTQYRQQVFCDGGLWANNPAVVGYSEAMHIAKICQRSGVDPVFAPHDIAVLSIGTGFSHAQYTLPAEGSGVKWWSRRVMEIMFSAQSQSVCFYLHKLIGDRFYRIDFLLPDPTWAKLDTTEHAGDLMEMGHQAGQAHWEGVANTFFQAPAVPFTPFPWDTAPLEPFHSDPLLKAGDP